MKSSGMLIHLGYHRTGSTFLQHVIFPKLEVQYVRLNQRHVLDLAKPGSFDSNAFRESVIFADKATQYSHKIISSEELSGDCYGASELDPFRVADRLKECYPNANILIVI